MPTRYDDDEPPTVPSRSQFPCPECRDDRGVPTGDVIAETTLGPGRKPCETCWGKRVIDFATLTRWRARKSE